MTRTWANRSTADQDCQPDREIAKSNFTTKGARSSSRATRSKVYRTAQARKSELARSMSAPTRGARYSLANLGKYLKQYDRRGHQYLHCELALGLTAWTDTDDAGRRRTRTWTSGVAVMRRLHLIKSGKSTHTIVA
eukprot:4592377-Pyramimonas_sp.AAC.1